MPCKGFDKMSVDKASLILLGMFNRQIREGCSLSQGTRGTARNYYEFPFTCRKTNYGLVLKTDIPHRLSSPLQCSLEMIPRKSLNRRSGYRLTVAKVRYETICWDYCLPTGADNHSARLHMLCSQPSIETNHTNKAHDG